MTTLSPPRSVTRVPWGPGLQHLQYATPDTYRLAAEWLKDCVTVADWGGGTGFFGTCLPSTVRYIVVDGTQQRDGQVIADLGTYQEPSDGILIRHVLEVVEDWRVVLRNALASFRQRMVVITFTPAEVATRIVKYKSGWPVRHFATADLVEEMGDLLVRYEPVETSHPERVYYLERR